MIEQLGKGALERPDHLKIKDHMADAVPPFNWSTVKEDIIGNKSGLFGITDQDQNGSSSCTCQALRYGFKYALGLDISSHDPYSHVVQPGGGAYLNAPLDYMRNNYALAQSKYPDPNPQSESGMTKIIQIQVGDEIKTYQCSYKFMTDLTIDSAAWAATQYDYCTLGIKGNNADWTTLTDPKYSGKNSWQHALMFGKESVVLRKSVPAIKTRSSWCNSGAYCHFINKNYFVNGGVFEIIGVNLKEISMGLVKKTLNNKGAIGIEILSDGTNSDADFAALNKIFGVSIVKQADGTIPTDDKI